jgi:hypothetical protein
MPYKSPEQNAYMHANEPEIAKEWDMKYPERGQRAATNKKGKEKQKAYADELMKNG